MTGYRNFTALHSSPLLKELLGIIRMLIADTDRRPKEGSLLRFVSTRKWTAAEQYAHEVFQHAAELSESIDQLDLALQCLSGFRAKSMKPFRRTDYLIYHLENHSIRVSGLLDRSFKLANALFELGLPPRECRENTVVDNSHVATTKVAVSIRKIATIVSPYTARKNEIVHHKRLREDTVQFLMALEMTEVDTPRTAKRFIDLFVAERKAVMSETNVHLREAVGTLFDHTLPEFEHRYRSHGGQLPRERA